MMVVGWGGTVQGDNVQFFHYYFALISHNASTITQSD